MLLLLLGVCVVTLIVSKIPISEIVKIVIVLFSLPILLFISVKFSKNNSTWELTEDGIDTTLITDGMCSYFMNKKMIDVVITGADRIAANGDTANKIGTYTVAISAKYHNVPFYIAAPLSTIDTSIASGEEIKIEERNREEVTHINGDWICAEKVNIINIYTSVF